MVERMRPTGRGRSRIPLLPRHPPPRQSVPGPARPPGPAPAGFTLVELLLVVSVLAVLSLVAVPRFTSSETDAKLKIDTANRAFIDMQWESKRIAEGSYGSLGDLLSDTEYFPDGPPACPFGSAYADANGDHRVDSHSH